MSLVNVLSLFDGISCGRVALKRANLKIDKYYASEIDKYAIQVAKKNYPDTAHLGDVNNWKDWNINWNKIDILFAGFPCQAWSIAGKQLGLEDERGRLALVLLDIFNHLKSINPNLIFLFENVRMKKENLAYMDNLFGVRHVTINSSLLSAQNRIRCYWTNIQNIEQPEDKKIYLKDILESGEVDRDKSYCIDANYFKGGSLKNYIEKARRQLVMRQSEKRLMVTYSSSGRGNGVIEDRTNDADKAATLTKTGYTERSFTGVIGKDFSVRKLTPIECERLQTLEDGYTSGISNSQRYKCLGNGWTVDVISHILSFIHKNAINQL